MIFCKKFLILPAQKIFSCFRQSFLLVPSYPLALSYLLAPSYPLALSCPRKRASIKRVFLNSAFSGILFLFTFASHAQNIQSLQREVQIQTNSKSLAHKMAVLEVSRDLIIDLLGREKYQAKKQYIEQNIIKRENRYLLSVSSSKGEWNDEGKFTFKVSMKISKDNLKKLLMEHNLLGYSKGTFCVLPLISFLDDSSGKKYSWWLDKKEELDEKSLELKKSVQAFFDLLSRELVKIGFYVQDPLFYQISQAVPPTILPKKDKDFGSLLDFYSCDIVLSGQVHIGKKSSSSLLSSFLKETGKPDKNWLEFSLRAFKVKSQYQILNLKKRMAVSSKDNLLFAFLAEAQKVVDSLAYQLSHHQEEGSLVWNHFMLYIQGALSYSDREKLARLLVQKSKSLENLKVQYMTADRVVYSAEVSTSLKLAVKDLKKLSLKAFNIQVRKTRNQAIEVYAQKNKK